ncbi:hypothetical protein C9J27_02170, partial [Photobacterium kishitanii]
MNIPKKIPLIVSCIALAIAGCNDESGNGSINIEPQNPADALPSHKSESIKPDIIIDDGKSNKPVDHGSSSHSGFIPLFPRHDGDSGKPVDPLYPDHSGDSGKPVDPLYPDHSGDSGKPVDPLYPDHSGDSGKPVDPAHPDSGKPVD